MKIAKLLIESEEVSDLLTFLKTKIQHDYINQSTDMIIICEEVSNFRNDSAQLNMMVLKLENNQIYIDLIGAAGGAGLFNLSWSSESRFIKKMKKLILTYCQQNHLNLIEFVDKKR